MRVLFLFLLLLVVPTPTHAAEPAREDWSFLPIDVIGARTFRTAHPEWDGRGVVIGILDCGIDLDVPGLTELPQGGVKIADLRDFSGEGDVTLTAVTRDTVDGRLAFRDGKDRRVFGVERFVGQAWKDDFRLGFLDESRFRGSSAPDLDNNGRRDDRFAVLAWPTVADAADSQWVAVIDLDGDGQLDDEQPVRSYFVAHDVLRFRSSTDQDRLHVLTASLTILPGEKKVEFHIADGSHATHVAGIAAGYRLAGQDGLEGVAPGAILLSLKIGNNVLSGGATTTESVKKALEWGAQWAEDHHMPIAFNMSYGIGSEIEGRSDVDKLIDTFMLAHPHLVYVCSNGNEGPGLSSTGTPAAARFAFSVGNLVSWEALRDLRGAGARRNHPHVSSSRGGEVAKPDVMAPGTVLSTVPPYDRSEVKNGTSMASPGICGAMALLMSAALAEHVDWTWGTLHQAVRASAKPLPGYTILDQGAGVPIVSAAWTTLQGLAPRAGGPLLSYRIEAMNPYFDDGKGPAAFWRANGWFPKPPRAVSVTVKPAFAKDATPDERVRFFRAFDLSSDVPWIRIDRGSTYIKGDDTANLNLTYDPAALREPGLYTGRVIAHAKGIGGPRVPEWEVWNTVIVPRRFTADNEDRLEWNGRGLEPGAIQHLFLEIPAGATSLEASLECARGTQGQARVILRDPEGHDATHLETWADAVAETKDIETVTGDRLLPGTWEAVVYANSGNHADADWRLEARIGGFTSAPDTVGDFATLVGDRPDAKITVTNILDAPFEGSAEGRVIGYRRERTIDVKDADTWEMPFRLGDDVESATFRVEFSDALYNRTTDCVLNVLDASGAPLVQQALGERIESIAITRSALKGADPDSLRLRVWAAFTYAGSKDDWSFDLRESYARRAPETITVTSKAPGDLLLVPSTPASLTLTLSASPRRAPDGCFNYGEVEFRDKARGKTRFVLPVRPR